MVQATGFTTHPASNVLVWGEHGQWGNDKFWLAKKEIGEGFTIKVDNCERMVEGCQIKNMGKGASKNRATKDFLVSGSIHENGTWQTLVQEDSIGVSSAVSAVLIMAVLMNFRTRWWEDKVLCVLMILRNIPLTRRLVDEVIYDNVVVL